MSQYNARRFFSYKDSVKLITGFLTALAIENALKQLAFFGSSNGTLPVNLLSVPLEVWLTMLVSITLTVRFFFGNIEYLNSKQSEDVSKMLLDTVTALIQTSILALISSYIGIPRLFYIYLVVLFIIELLWYFATYIMNHFKKEVKFENFWNQLTSFFTVIALFWLAMEFTWPTNAGGFFQYINNIEVHSITAFWIMFINSFVDLIINGKRYLDIGRSCDDN